MRIRGSASLLALLAFGCLDFHQTGPEDPDAVPAPRLVSVTIEYRQPNGCVNLVTRCDTPVVFFGSWMRPGLEFVLSFDPANYVWRATAAGVPVNFPPRDAAYNVRVYDPYLAEDTNAGWTAERLKVGGQTLTRLDRPGSPYESGLIYIDENGIGHSPF